MVLRSNYYIQLGIICELYQLSVNPLTVSLLPSLLNTVANYSNSGHGIKIKKIIPMK